MALNPKEQLLLEAIGSLLTGNAKLGLPLGEKITDKESSHNMQFEWEGITDLFRLKVQDLTHRDAITSTFFKIHGYKYIDDPTFKISFEKDLESQGTPKEEIGKALAAIDEVKDEILKKNDERAFGWNRELDKIQDITSNANDRDAKTLEPWSGGGPAPKK